MGNLATFLPNKKEPVYNWFYFEEGFSKGLVFRLLEEFNIEKNSVVLDPFCGSGTTLLACKQKGIDSIGLDVMPVCVFSSIVKTRDYNIEELREYSRDIFSRKFERLQEQFPKIMKRGRF